MGARRFIVDWLASHPEVTFSAAVEYIVAEADVSQRVARNRVSVTFNKMVASGKLERVGVGTYRLAAKGEA